MILQSYLWLHVMIFSSSGSLNRRRATRAFPHFMHASVDRCIRGQLHSPALFPFRFLSDLTWLPSFLHLSPFQCLNRIIGMPTIIPFIEYSLIRVHEWLIFLRILMWQTLVEHCFFFLPTFQTMPKGTWLDDVSVYPPLFVTFPLWREERQFSESSSVAITPFFVGPLCLSVSVMIAHVPYRILSSAAPFSRIENLDLIQCYLIHVNNCLLKKYTRNFMFSFHQFKNDQSPDLSVNFFCVARQHFNEFVAVVSV